ncbi:MULTISPECIES: HlyD family secretion protein [Paraburkholderia]|uniref:HlyD family secretion protein n=1 Tax=Paraburkholderia TaxID=1822464 RepID=UPI00286714B5|nr:MULTISPECIES: HlyD family efflux transporter periplasmic adaptor subunit [Paraburkholderia]MDR6383466.1 HlyD family secretion protein [Paraburkholderia caribensis]MDR6388925.1 HlyD family secretion protein [Paraburkholderia phenoliruptrix]MDR6419236.1 HlyD family secretion protein [Paraburkholderia phenoliruptrix]
MNRLLRMKAVLRYARTATIAAAAFVTGCSRPPTNAYQGYVEGDYLYMASSQAGRLVNLAVQRGQAVAAGGLLFALEANNEQDALDQARHQANAAQAQYWDLLSGKRPEEIRVNTAQLEQARADAERSRLQSLRDEAQFRAGGISKAQADDSRAAAASGAARVREMDAQLQVAHLPSRTAQIREQWAQVQASRAAMAQAQWRLDEKRVSALRGGLVFDTMYREGEWVPAGSPVVRMLPPGNVKVRFFIGEAVVGEMRLGSRVLIRCDGCAADVPATVSYVSDQAEYTPQMIYSNETRSKLVFMVEARPSRDDATKLHPGQPVEVITQ